MKVRILDKPPSQLRNAANERLRSNPTSKRRGFPSQVSHPRVENTDPSAPFECMKATQKCVIER
jgi:hypothetical protein